ncbi:MAG: 3-dehydroquinate synthase [Saprospiraceae bacterium]|nr:3-dehydroquinate synthase [Saprospiraceae bacterium]
MISNLYIGENNFSELNKKLNDFNGSRVFILVDENIKQHCLPILIQNLPVLKNHILIKINSGEGNKNLAICEKIWQKLLDSNADRNSLLINLGGGVITDIGGFCASTFKRGMNFINIPTTLLAQVDASFGGKTGIDFNGIKNQIGTFCNPTGVFIFPEFLKTLPENHLKAGYAEMIKHALISDKKQWNELNQKSFKEINNWEILIKQSIAIKTKIITDDPFEKGDRKALNFGHTIGHAIESYSMENDSSPLLHGEAVAIGLICESCLSQMVNNFNIKHLNEITTYINSNFQPYIISNYKKLIEIMLHDKKNENGKINFTLISEPGKFTINNFVETEQIIRSLDYYQNSLMPVKNKVYKLNK